MERGGANGVQLGTQGAGRIQTSEADPSNNLPANQFSASHRKFASYKLVGSAADADDHSEGHGAHVAGTLSGSFLPSLASSPEAAVSLAHFDGPSPLSLPPPRIRRLKSAQRSTINRRPRVA